MINDSNDCLHVFLSNDIICAIHIKYCCNFYNFQAAVTRANKYQWSLILLIM